MARRIGCVDGAGRRRSARPGAGLGGTAVLAALALWAVGSVWYSLGDHPLYVPDEGRYARTTQVMIAGGDLLVPRIDNEVRLQKPPLVHWMQGAAMLAWGENEWAARLPGAACGTLAALIVLAAGWRGRDLRTGLIAVVLMHMMPLVLVVDRLAIIDPILHLFWLAALVLGYDATRRRGDRALTGLSGGAAVWGFWIAVSLAALAKGPVGLIPAGIVLLWCIVRGRSGSMRRWHWPAGMLLAVAPLGAWVASVAATQPEAWALWWRELVDRAAGSGDHVQPWYYYLPVFFAGLFPAAAMLPVIGWHVRLRRVRAAVRRGHALAYLAIATAVPLAIFTAIGGKLATYLLPIAAPVALIAAWQVRSWLDVTEDHGAIAGDRRHRARRLPDGVSSVAVVIAIGWLIGMALAIWPGAGEGHGFRGAAAESLASIVGPLALTPVLAIAGAVLWRRCDRRALALALIVVAYLAAVDWAMEAGEDHLTAPYSNRLLLAEIDRTLGDHPRRLMTYGYRDQSLSFYASRDVLRIDRPEKLTERPAAADEDLVVIADAEEWRRLDRRMPRFTGRFRRALSFDRARDEVWVMVNDADEHAWADER